MILIDLRCEIYTDITLTNPGYITTPPGSSTHATALLWRREELTYGGLKRNGQLGVEVSHGGQQLRVVGRVDVDAAQEVQLVCQVVHALLVQRSRLTTGGHPAGESSGRKEAAEVRQREGAARGEAASTSGFEAMKQQTQMESQQRRRGMSDMRGKGTDLEGFIFIIRSGLERGLNKAFDSILTVYIAVHMTF